LTLPTYLPIAVLARIAKKTWTSQVHAQAMLKIPREGIHDAQAQMDEAKKLGFPLA